MSYNRRNQNRATFGQAWIESRYWLDILEWIRLAEMECQPSARLSADVQRGTQPPTPEGQ